MRTLITLVLVLFTTLVGAQTFEGTIRWSMSMQFSDPAMQAQMAQAQQQMNDPEVQAQLKEMEAKMNDPEMKKMMDENPQMKAAMENALKMAKGGGPGNSGMMPTSMTIRMKGANTSTLMEGGVVDGMEMLNRAGETPVRINRKESTYSKVPEGHGAPGGSEPEMTVTKGNETMKILGYTCQKYLVQMKVNGETVNQVMWTTTDIKDIDMKAMARQRNDQGRPLFSDKVAGMPLKIEVMMPQGSMVMEVTELKRAKLNDSDFTIPAGFKEVKFP